MKLKLILALVVSGFIGCTTAHIQEDAWTNHALILPIEKSAVVAEQCPCQDLTACMVHKEAFTNISQALSKVDGSNLKTTSLVTYCAEFDKNKAKVDAVDCETVCPDYKALCASDKAFLDQARQHVGAILESVAKKENSPAWWESMLGGAVGGAVSTDHTDK